MKITVVGSINKDVIMKTERHPKPGETLTALETGSAFGGKGANQAVAAARLGSEVSMIGAVGQDATGEEQLAHFRKEGINVEGIERSEVTSGVAYITVDTAGENSIILYPGANGEVAPQWVEQNRSAVEKADILMLQMEIPLESSLAAAHIAAEAGVKIVFNPAPVHPVPDELYPLVDLLTPNESELALLAGEKDVEKAARLLLDRGVKAVLVTLGGKGSRYISKEQDFTMPTYVEVPVVDTTAAGDSFNAGVAVSIAGGKSPEEAAAFASAVGSLAVSRAGAQPSLPLIEEVNEFIETHEKLNIEFNH